MSTTKVDFSFPAQAALMRALIFIVFEHYCFAADLTITSTNSIELVEFQASDFLMGCPNNPPEPWQTIHFDVSRPEHRVQLSAFSISKYPITESQYCDFLNDVGFDASYTQHDKLFRNIRRKPNYNPKRIKDDYPVSGVSFIGAEAYCRWLSKKTKLNCRLPTEAEWEFVARGKQNRTYPWGETNYPTDQFDLFYKPVGIHQKLATPEGVHDMYGPVNQWCLDKYDAKFYFKSPKINPVCTNGTSQTVRGGPGMRWSESWFKEHYVFPPTWKRFHGFDVTTLAGFRVVVENSSAQANMANVREKTINKLVRSIETKP